MAKKKGEKYECPECGLVVIIEDDGCECQECDVVCCSVPMEISCDKTEEGGRKEDEAKAEGENETNFQA